MREFALEVQRRLAQGVVIDEDDPVSNTCKFVATIVVGFHFVEPHGAPLKPIMGFLVDTEGDLRLQITKIHRHWTKFISEILRSKEQYLKTVILMKQIFQTAFYVDLKEAASLKLYVGPADEDYFICKHCTMHYTAAANWKRCEASHTTKYCPSRHGIYDRKELTQFWDELSAPDRLAILEARQTDVPIPGGVMGVSATALFEAIEETMEYTNLFRLAKDPAASQDITDVDVDRECAAIVAGRISDAFVDAFAAFKQLPVLKILEKEARLERKKCNKKHRAKIVKISKNLHKMPPIAIGMNGKWWEEEY